MGLRFNPVSILLVGDPDWFTADHLARPADWAVHSPHGSGTDGFSYEFDSKAGIATRTD
jgi:hypothetical protein